MPEWSRDKLLALSAGFMKARILISAAELDLFSKIEREPLTANDLASREGWDRRALTIMLDALAAMGLLTKDPEGRYGPEPSLVGLLSTGSEGSVLPMILHRCRMWETWSNLTSIVQTGKNPSVFDMSERPPEEMEVFIGAMHVVGRDAARRVAKSLDLSGFRRMLDLGGGPGTYTIAFLEKAPELRATLFDLPNVVEMARRRISEAGLADRVDFVPGDFRTDELPSGYDLVFVSAIIHMNSREQNRDLFAKVLRSLDNGGKILIRDYFLDSTRTRPPEGAIFAVNMLAGTEEGNSYTFDEVREDLEATGFRDVVLAADGPQMEQVMAAVK